MAIVNRDLDSSQQRDVVSTHVGNTITGQTYNLLTVPYPAQLLAAQQAVCGLSGAPNHSLWVQRMVVGTGITSVAIGQSVVPTTFGTSGPVGFTVLQTGGASFLLQAGDEILLSTSAANTAAVSVNVTLVLKKLQDIVTDFGV